MANSLPVSQEPISQGPVSQEPAGGFSFKQMLPTLVFDVAMPIVAFNVLTGYGVSKLWALAAGGLFPAINNLRSWAKSRRLEPLGIIVMAFLAIGTATSLISGSVFFALIKELFLTAAFGLICLGSLLLERPLMFYIIRQFVAGLVHWVAHPLIPAEAEIQLFCCWVPTPRSGSRACLRGDEREAFTGCT